MRMAQFERQNRFAKIRGQIKCRASNVQYEGKITSFTCTYNPIFEFFVVFSKIARCNDLHLENGKNVVTV